MSVELGTRYLGLELPSPVVASSTPWTGDPEVVRRLEDAGAGAVVLPSLFEEEVLNEELQLSRSLEQGDEQFGEALSYFPRIQQYSGTGDRYLDRLEKTRRRVSIPVVASLNATTPGGWVRYARLMQDAGADGLVLFNRFYQPDLDLETLDVVTSVTLSSSAELRLPLRWIALLRPHLGRGVGLAATSGVHTGADAAKALLVGADVAMVASAVLQNGVGQVGAIVDGLADWMAEHEYESVAQMRGAASAAKVADPSLFERANYMAVLRSFSTPADLAR